MGSESCKMEDIEKSLPKRDLMGKRDFIFDKPEVDQYFRQLLQDSQRLAAIQKITKRKLHIYQEHEDSDNLMVRYLAIVLRPRGTPCSP